VVNVSILDRQGSPEASARVRFVRRLALAATGLLLAAAACGGARGGSPPAWGRAGTVTVPGVRVAQLLQDGSGRILALGIDGRSRAVVLRFTSSGTPDRSFGESGAVHWPSARQLGWSFGALLPQGRILLAGATRFGALDTQSSLVMTVLNSDGRMDSTFGRRGYVTTTLQSCLRGPLALAVSGGTVTVTLLRMCAYQSPHDVVLSRLDTRGRRTLAPVRVASIPSAAIPTAPIALLSRGRVAVAVPGTRPGSVAVTLFDRSGHREGSFGSRGTATAAVAVDSATLYVGGTFANDLGRLAVTGCTGAGPYLVRFNRNGSPYRYWGGGANGQPTNVEQFGGAFGSRCAAFAQRGRGFVAAGAALARVQPYGFVDVRHGLAPLPAPRYYAVVPTHVLLAVTGGSTLVATRRGSATVIERFR
jgi:hypothetical protein